MSKEIIAVTGGTGFVGKNLIAKLIPNYKIKIFNREKTPPDKDRKLQDVEVVFGDLVTDKSLADFLSGVDTLIHLAARLTPPEEEMFANNVVATNNLINAALKTDIRHIIYMSTAAVYGNIGRNRNVPFSEEDLPLPDATYALTKYLGEIIVKFWGTKTGNPTTILRPFNVYGPGNRKGVVYNFYRSFKDKDKITIFGDGKQKRDFLYVDDLTRAILASIKKRADGVFNLGTGKSVSLLELVELFAKITGRKPRVEFQDAEPGKVNKLKYSTEKSKRELNWTPAVSLEDGLRRTIQWYQQNP